MPMRPTKPSPLSVTIYPGIHVPAIAHRMPRFMMSANVLERRRSNFATAGPWILDSGAFTRITSGRGHMPASQYAAMAERWTTNGNLIATVTQDWMTEPIALNATGLTVKDHQRLTTDRYFCLASLAPHLPWMPVLQGQTPTDYHNHARDLRDHLPANQWIGVGSVCKRQSNFGELVRILETIKTTAPDWKLHGFGVKTTALTWKPIADLLESADSMAWSYEARYGKRHPADTANSADTALRWLARVEAIKPLPKTRPLF